MSEQDIEQVASPPTESEPVDFVQESTWPKTIGIFSIIYALLGLTCGLFAVGAPWLVEFSTRLGGIEMTFPPLLKIMAVVSGAIMFILGLMLFFGGIRLLRRKPTGISLLKKWVIARVVFLMISFTASVLTAPTQVDFQRQANDIRNEAVVKGNRPDMVLEFDEDSTWRLLMIQSAVMTSLIAIYPLFLGFYISRKKISDEVNTWESGMFF